MQMNSLQWSKLWFFLIRIGFLVSSQWFLVDLSDFQGFPMVCNDWFSCPSFGWLPLLYTGSQWLLFTGCKASEVLHTYVCTLLTFNVYAESCTSTELALLLKLKIYRICQSTFTTTQFHVAIIDISVHAYCKKFWVSFIPFVCVTRKVQEMVIIVCWVIGLLVLQNWFDCTMARIVPSG